MRRGAETDFSGNQDLLDDLDGRSGRRQIEQIGDVAVAHAHAADRAGPAQFGAVRRAVNVDEAAHGIHVPEAVAPRFAAGKPEDAGEDPVAAGMLVCKFA